MFFSLILISNKEYDDVTGYNCFVVMHSLQLHFKVILCVLTSLSVLQFPSSVTPVCSPPSHLWTASNSPSSAPLGSSACPAEPWARKVSESLDEKQNRDKAVAVSHTETDACDVISGDFRVVLYEKSCVLPILCGVTGEKYTMGLNFTFTNECCNTHLCNGAATLTSPWTATLLMLLAVHLAWWRKTFDKSGSDSVRLRSMTANRLKLI